MKAKSKKPLKLDKRSYILFAVIGLLLITVILLIKTRFKEDMRLSDDGFAIVSGTVTESLSADPNDYEVDISETVQLYEFKALDYFYTQSKYFYLGEDKKTQIDTSYPLYMKNGNALQLMNANGILFDEDYEQVTTFKGLYIQDGNTFNANGEQVDPMKFLFLELNNGNFINLVEITYEEKDREYDINANSIVHFENDYFSYYEYEDGTLLYKCKISVNDYTELNVNGVSHTYDELLKLLGLRSERPVFDSETETEAPSEPETEAPTETVVDTENETESEPQEEETTEKETESVTEETTEVDEEESTEEKEEGNKVSPGVRPDSMRPDKGDKDDGSIPPQKVPEYIKPEVNVTEDFVGKVYRLVGEIEVIDPAKRIDSKKVVQFEVYEIDDKGNKNLVTRSYCSGSGTVVLGGGSIKPETEYQIVGFFTYNNEYDQSIVEPLGEWTVSTKGVDTLGTINLVHNQNITYSDRIELENVSFSEDSDDEAVYGINNTAGITLIVRNESGNKEITKKILANSDVTNFKRNARLVVSTLAVLEAKTTYSYEFVMEDYFGNDLKLKNNTGFAVTCNNTPKANLKVETNEIGNVQINVKVTDVDAAVAPALNSTTECDIYLIIMKNAYGVKSLDDENVVTYHKFDSSEYEYSEDTGLKIENKLVSFETLDLDESLYAAVYCDYDLDNFAGVQRFMNVGQLKFTTKGLSSLGRIYVDVVFDDSKLKHDSVPISYTLNLASTNPELSKLIVGFETDVTGGTGDDKLIYNTLGFSKESIANDVQYLYQKFRAGETLTYNAHDLESMTTYNLEPRVYLEYNGKVYDNVNVVLSKSTFKTLRKPAEVVVDNLLFAAGTLVFDATVYDPDEAITGASGDKVVVNLYTTTGEFVRATRIEKNQPNPETITFTGLDVNKQYEIRFLAVEYNEGYSNATYISNYTIKTVKVSDSVKIDGTIKLQEIVKIPDNDIQNNAIVKATINDNDHYLSGRSPIPYYISIEKNGNPIDTYEYWKNEEPVESQYVTNYEYPVDIGNNTYKVTLYVVISERTLVLDTLEFTTETTVKGFSNAYEMINLIEEDPTGKFVATNSFVLNSNSWNFPGIVDPGDVSNFTEEELAAAGIVMDQGISGANITSIFDGSIDFQGFTLTHNYYADGQKIFTNIGAKGEISKMVYKVFFFNESYIYDEGILCYRNYGKISDVFVDFAGSYNVFDNRYFGLLCRINCSSGIIENFVIKNKPQTVTYAGEEVLLNGISAHQYMGMVASDNYGIVRYGYVYGDNIIATNATANIDRRVGGIIGTNQSIGKIYSVYSLINVDQTLRDNTQKLTYGYRYGAICGYSTGVIQNMYSAAESMYPEAKNSTTDYYQKSPVVGDTASRNINVYFYSPSGFDYIYPGTSALKGVNEMSINNFYDPGWQSAMLTESFNTSLVEVGYYPQVNMAEDLPEQEYIPLPSRVMSGDVDISRAKVTEYVVINKGTAEEKDAAIVEFVFSNREGLDIASVEIEGLTVELDLQNAKTEDGYTTIMGLVSDPVTYNSEYLIRKISYYRNNALKENTTDYMLLVDFYRNIYTVDDWYNYVVLKATEKTCENVRLKNDLDFANVDASKIMVTATFTAKIDGNNKCMKNIDLQDGFKATNASTVRNLFTASPSIDYSGEVKNLYIDNYKAGGTYVKSNKTYVARYGAVFRNVKGVVDGVHLTNANITSFNYVAGIAAYADVGAEIKNCTVTGLNITYLEPDGQNIDACIGGVVAYITNSRISHCLATGINIKADEMKGSLGIGGVVGYAVNTAIDTVYAQGDIEARGSKMGGVIGEYYSTSSAVACIKNVFAKVDLISYTDSVGGLIGQINITQERISERNNFSGIAFGNVYVSNTDSKNITHTIGSNIGKNIKFYGTDRQLVNGMAGIDVDDYAQTMVVGLLGFDDLSGNSAKDTYINEIGFDNVYDYSYAENGFLPKMYEEDSTKLLPNQPDILLDDTAEYDIEVTNVYTNTTTKVITVELRNPLNYKILDINIEKLGDYCHYANLAANPSVAVSIEEASDYSEGYTRIYLQYADDLGDDGYYLDSYIMNNIEFYNVENSYEMTGSEVENNIAAGIGEKVDLPTFSRIGVTLYMDIANREDWNHIFVRENNGHIYENYRVISDIDFTSYTPSHNLRVGRLVGVSGSGITIRNVTLSGTGKKLIDRLNSGISDLTFENCEISSKSQNCTGLIGVNNGSVKNCTFRNITITPTSSNIDEVGIIAHQNGGELSNINLDTIKVNAYTSKITGIDYVGALCGRITDGSTLNNITGINLEVSGATTVGGLAGQLYISDITDVALTNVIVSSNGNYAGGLCGRLGTNSNGRAGAANNVTITGTPTYDSNGVIIDSTTKITSAKGSYVGGVVGSNYHKSGENYATSDYEVAANGIYVQGYAQMIGGIFGYNYSEVSHLTISNSLIVTSDTTDTSYYRVGGIMGYVETGTHRYLTADNIRINSKNHSQVGGLIGYLNKGGLQYSTISDSVINASSKTIGTWTCVGGVVGYVNTGTLIYNGSFNTVINADSMDMVGGIVGRAGTSGSSSASIQRCYNISDYDEQAYTQYGTGTTRYTAAAKDEYYIKGHNYVGGITGYLKGGNIQYSYSNNNVIADNKQCAGGLTGYYGNEYTVAAGGAKSYPNVQIFRNYFAGSVTAPEGYAGGAIGRTGLIATGLGTDSKGAITGSGVNGSRIKGVNGNANEMDKTYGNIIFADSITGAEDRARSFAADDKEYYFTGKNNTIWEGTKVNGTYSSVVKNNATNDYAYEYWDATNSTKTSYPTNTKKMLLFKHSDLDGSQIWNNNAKYNRAAIFYRNIGWGLQNTNNKTYNYANRNTVWAMSVGSVCVDKNGNMKNLVNKKSTDTVRGMYNVYEAGLYDKGSFLPQIRSSATDTKYAADYSITLQNMMPRLPLPKDDNCSREVINGAVAETPVINTYGYIYPSDIDKINVEFSDDLINKGYFVIKVGDNEIARGIITNKVYTFSYNFVDNIVFEYGFELVPTDIINLEAKDLCNSVMVYDDSYYYISEDGVVALEDTFNGEFVHLMNGKALDKQGFVWNLSDHTVIKNASSPVMQDMATPLWSFDYLGYTINTYAKHSQIVSDNTNVMRNDQLFVYNGKLYTVDGDMETNRTSLLLYNLNGTEYLTVLGLDGIMVDLYNQDSNIPDSVDNKAIARMSSTIDADIPYVMLEYSNGGILCYNYATGEIVLDNTIADNKNLFEYAKDYFDGEEKSIYHSVNNTYKPNASIAANINSTKDLEDIIGNSIETSFGDIPSDMPTGEASTNQSKADPNNTEIPDGNFEEGTSENETDEVITTAPTTESTDESTSEAVTEEITDAITDSKENNESNESTEEITTENETSTDSSVGDVDSTKYMTLYNSNTGVYEIINVSEYLSSDSFVSENAKLGVKDFSEFENGFATSKKDASDENGIIFYVIPVLLIFVVAAGVEVYVSYRRSKKNTGV